MGLQMGLCHVVHVLLDGLQELCHLFGKLIQGYGDLLPGITSYQDCLVVLDVSGSDLHPKGDASHLAVGKLPARALVAVVHLDSEALLQKLCLKLCGLLQDALLLLLYRDDDHLGRCDPGGQTQAVVVSVHHDDGADDTGGYAPGGLVYVLQLVVLIAVLDVEGFGKAVAEVVGGT